MLSHPASTPCNGKGLGPVRFGPQEGPSVAISRKPALFVASVCASSLEAAVQAASVPVARRNRAQGHFPVARTAAGEPFPLDFRWQRLHGRPSVLRSPALRMTIV